MRYLIVLSIVVASCGTSRQSETQIGDGNVMNVNNSEDSASAKDHVQIGNGNVMNVNN